MTKVVEPEVLDSRLSAVEHGDQYSLPPVLDGSARIYAMLGSKPWHTPIWAVAANKNHSVTTFAVATDKGIFLADENAVPKRSKDRRSKFQPSDTLAVDWLDANVVLSGCRSGHVRMWDTRTDGTSMRMVHPSSTTHVRKLNDNIIVVAGLMHQLHTYDLRFPASRPSAALTTPYTTFPAYRNWANVLPPLGLDVHGDLIAVGCNDATIMVFDHSSGNEALDLGMSRNFSKCQGQVRCIKFWEQFEDRIGGYPSVYYSAENKIGVLTWDLDD